MSAEDCDICASSEGLTLSWSKLLTHESCKKKYQLEKQGLKSPVVNTRVFLPGTVCDLAMRRWLDEDAVEDGAMVRYVGEELAKKIEQPEGVIKWIGSPVEDQHKVLMWCESVVKKLEPLLRKYVTPYDYEPELRFSTPAGLTGLCGHMTIVRLLGGIDILVRRGEDDYVIYDLKTTANNKYVQGKTLAQLTFYDIALRSMQGVYAKETAFLVPGADTVYVPVAVTDQDRGYMLGRMEKWLSAVQRKDYAMTQNLSECKYCYVKHACPRWAPTQSEDGKRRVSIVTASATA